MCIVLFICSAYPDLVHSLQTIFAIHHAEEFLMSWNRRIADSITFFDMMKAANFDCFHHGHCIYSFTRSVGCDLLSTATTIATSATTV